MTTAMLNLIQLVPRGGELDVHVTKAGRLLLVASHNERRIEAMLTELELARTNFDVIPVTIKRLFDKLVEQEVADANT